MSFAKLAAYLLALASLALAGGARAASVHLLASSAAIRIGDEVTISLEISGLGAGSGDSLGAFDVDVRFDESLLRLTSFSFVDPLLGSNPLDLVELGALPFLGDGWVNGDVLDAFGASGNAAEVLDLDQVGTFRFFSARFVALAPGLASAMLDLLDPRLVFAGSGGAELSVAFGVSAVAVRIAPQSLPEPSAAGCLALACIALLLRSVRLRRQTLSLLGLSFVGLGLPASAQTTSPFEPEPEDHGRYVLNGGTGLDTGCTFRSAGPLIIQIKVPATMNPLRPDGNGRLESRLDEEGKLVDADFLIRNRVIDAFATLRFPVFDIDSGANEPGVAPEVDEIRFNGHRLMDLSGSNNEWTDDTREVPIQWVRFATPDNPDVTNELRIDIDVANKDSGRDVWCMAVDWFAVQFQAALPYVLAHGIAADETTWDEKDAPGVLAALNARGVLYTRFSLKSNGETSTNGRLLQGKIQGFLDETKAKRVHVIAHSKGGLDTQRMVALAPAPAFEVKSLTTRSTPHLGSVAADLSVIGLRNALLLVNNGQDPNGYVSDYLNISVLLNGVNTVIGAIDFANPLFEIGKQGPLLPGLNDLTLDSAASDRDKGFRGNIPSTFTISADADVNEDGDISIFEADGLFPQPLELVLRPGRTAWRVLRDFSRTRVASLLPAPGFPIVIVYETFEADGPQANDIVVSKSSAMPDYGIPIGSISANHSTMKNGVVIPLILNRTINLR